MSFLVIKLLKQFLLDLNDFLIKSCIFCLGSIFRFPLLWIVQTPLRSLLEFVVGNRKRNLFSVPTIYLRILWSFSIGCRIPYIFHPFLKDKNLFEVLIGFKWKLLANYFRFSVVAGKFKRLINFAVIKVLLLYKYRNIINHKMI